MSDPVSATQSDLDLWKYMGVDAAKWTEKFCEQMRQLFGVDLPAGREDVVHTWFCGAIETGRQAGAWHVRESFCVHPGKTL